MGIKSYLEKKAFSDIYRFKNLPLKTDENIGNTWHSLSIIYPAYVENGKTELIEVILHQYDSISEEVLNHLEIVLIDDCSPNIEKLIDTSKYKVKISLLRILDNIKWNSGGAKNLGVFVCSSERIIITDIDHFFPEDALVWAMRTELKDSEVYHFRRVNTKGETERIHPNTFLMTRDTYIRLYGYDEDFCGIYGDDIFFRIYMKRNVHGIYLSSKECICYDINAEAHSLSRKLGLRLYVLIWLKKYRHSQKSLRFRWKYIESNKGKASL